MNRIYLDYAAATPVNKRVLDVMLPYFTDKFYNPSALYEGAREAKSDLDDARSKVASLIGARPSEVIFTAGGTESANLAVQGVMMAHPEGEVLVSAVEHEAVLNPAEQFNCQQIDVDEFGMAKTESLKKMINDNTVLVSVMYANNEIGTVQPIKKVVEIIENVRTERSKKGNKIPIFVHIDACQAPLYLDINVARLGVDMMTLNGGKIHGPKQSGILYRKTGVNLNPVIRGGGQEWGMRSGTENVAFAVGFAKALELADKGRSERAKNVQILRDYFMNRMEDKFSGVINGHRKHRLSNNVHVIFPGCDNERVLFSLDDLGVDAAIGSACSASKETASHVLKAIGKTDTEARSSIRFTLGEATTKEEIESVIEKLEIALKS
jgi:cysteine desulfurase